MTVRRLSPEDAAAYMALRLEALKNEPTAFSAGYEDNARRPLSEFAMRLEASEHRAMFGAFDTGTLVGTVGLYRELGAKERHKAVLYAMYVSPLARRRGVAHALVTEALGFARAMDQVRQVRLAVEAGNLPARALYRSFGFTEFGREQRALFVDGRFYDEIYLVLFLDGSSGPRQGA